MNSELCNKCGAETLYPATYKGLVPCSICGKLNFPCDGCRTSTRDYCDWDEASYSCTLYTRPCDDTACVAVGGLRADHWVICSYVVMNGSIEITGSWLLYKNYVRHIKLVGYLEQVALDGLAGFIS